jgi:hypothetical protein
MKSHSTKLLGCLDQRSSDLITPAVLVSFDEVIEVRCAGSNSFLFKLKSSSQNSFPNAAALHCGVVLIMVSTEQSLARIGIALDTAARTIISCKQGVFKALDPRESAPMRNGIFCAFICNLCHYWLKSFVCSALVRSRTILSLIHHSVRVRLC